MSWAGGRRVGNKCDLAFSLHFRSEAPPATSRLMLFLHVNPCNCPNEEQGFGCFFLTGDTIFEERESENICGFRAASGKRAGRLIRF